MTYTGPTQNKIKMILQDIAKDSEVFRLLKEHPEELIKKYNLTKEEVANLYCANLYLRAKMKNGTITLPTITIVIPANKPDSSEE